MLTKYVLVLLYNASKTVWIPDSFGVAILKMGQIRKNKLVSESFLGHKNIAKPKHVLLMSDHKVQLESWKHYSDIKTYSNIPSTYLLTPGTTELYAV